MSDLPVVNFPRRLAAIGAAAAMVLASIIATAAPATSSDDTDEPICNTQIPGLGPSVQSKVPNRVSSQIVVVRGVARDFDENTFERWEKINGCWTQLSAWWALNGYNGWSGRPQTGSWQTPTGIFSLTDTGGRLPNPGTSMRYDYGPQWYWRGGYKIDYPVQLYNYVVAINFNRRIGKPPRDERQPSRRVGSGYWIHERGLGSTRGCVSLTRAQLVVLLRWLTPSARPYIVMGPPAWLAH
jgi:L,D-peptidoglycan transpeptidase YkuD (ErfK/YbiS/YcfS/YnhG family)